MLVISRVIHAACNIVLGLADRVALFASCHFYVFNDLLLQRTLLVGLVPCAFLQVMIHHFTGTGSPENWSKIGPYKPRHENHVIHFSECVDVDILHKMVEHGPHIKPFCREFMVIFLMG